MNKNYQFLWMAMMTCSLLLTSCSKDDDQPVLEPGISMTPLEKDIELTLDNSLTFQALNENESTYQEEWLLDDKEVSSSSTYTFTAETTGAYLLIYNAYNEGGYFNYVYQINVVPKPVDVTMSVEEKEIDFKVGEKMVFEATNENNSTYSEQWTLNGSIVSETGSYTFEPQGSGSYTLVYEASNATGSFNYQYQINVTPPIRPITENSSAYVSELLEFLPAPGQFINKKPGNMESAQSVVGVKNGLVSLGGWGGSISFKFDHTVINQEDKKDLIIYGNPSANLAEPGVIYVMQDDNGNGIADDTWYEIKGSAHDQQGTLRDYEITYFRPENSTEDIPWQDNQGNKGVIAKNAFHSQAYYPQWITEDSYTISGTLLSDSHIDMSNPSYITSMPFDYGYADNTVGGDQIDLADAIDQEGNPVSLSGIDFIKIQTGIQANMGWLGELSTEVTGVADLSLVQ